MTGRGSESSEFLQLLEQDGTLRFHREMCVAKCVGDNIRPVEMLFLFSKSSGISLPSNADMLRVMSGFRFEFGRLHWRTRICYVVVRICR